MGGTLIKEAWQLLVQPGFTAHSRDSYMRPGALRDADLFSEELDGVEVGSGADEHSTIGDIVLNSWWPAL